MQCKYTQLYHGGQFDWWRKLEYPEKTTDLSQVTDKLDHIMLYDVSAKTGWLRIRIMCPNGATCLSVDYCFSELAL
jgi:hypothetical protein